MTLVGMPENCQVTQGYQNLCPNVCAIIKLLSILVNKRNLSMAGSKELYIVTERAHASLDDDLPGKAELLLEKTLTQQRPDVLMRVFRGQCDSCISYVGSKELQSQQEDFNG